MDSYTKTTTKGYGSRIFDSIKGIFFGVILFILSFVVLWINEGTVDLSKIAKTSIVISSEEVDSENNDKLISISEKLKTEDLISDGIYLTKQNLLAIKREVEMYAWEETTSSKSETNMGGSETTTTTYDYDKKWTSNPQSSDSFEVTTGHINPIKTINGNSIKASSGKIGIYEIGITNLSLPKYDDISSLQDKLIDKNSKLEGNYIYVGSGSLSAPVLGDMKISFKKLDNNIDVTLLGKQNNKKIESYVDKDGNKLFRAFYGSREEAIQTLRSEYKMKLWLFRAIGFFMMWIGLTLIVGPISVVLDFLPIAGKITRAIASAVAFAIALVLSFITIIISMIFHNIYLLIGLIAILSFWLYKYIEKKKIKPSVSDNVGS